MKTKVLNICAANAQLICVFVFAYAKNRFIFDGVDLDFAWGCTAKHDDQGLDISDLERSEFKEIAATCINANELICCAYSPAVHMPNVEKQMLSINYQSPVRTQRFD